MCRYASQRPALRQHSPANARLTVRRNQGDRALVYVTFRHVTCTLEQINRENRGSNPEYVIFPEGNGVAKFRIISKQNGVYKLERDPYSTYVLHSDIKPESVTRHLRELY